MTTINEDREVIFLKKTAQSGINRQGFTLVELLVVIAIIGILALVVLLVVNPIELTKRSRDATRLSDLSNLQTAINVTMQESTASNVLCNGTSGTCTGDSSTGTRVVDGTGWVKVDLSGQKSVTMSTLPIDPVNSSTYKYTYGVNSAGTGYEIDSVMESSQYASKMTGDGGLDNGHYEVGTDLTAIAP